MAKTIRSLLKISMAIRNLGMLTNYTFSKRLIQTSSCYRNYGKDSLVSARPYLVSQNTEETKPVQLQNELRNCNDQNELFTIIEINHKNMSVSDAVLALDVLFNISKNAEKDRNKVYLRKEFLMLCEILKNKIRHLSASDALSVLKTLIYFKVPSTSIIVQVMLQMIRGSINHLSLQQIMFFNFLLTKCEETPLVEALKTALPIVFESNLALKIDSENMNFLISALNYLNKYSTNTDAFAIVIHAINNYNQPISSAQAKSIFWALYHLQCFPAEFPEICNNIQSILAKDLSSLDRQSVKDLVRMITHKVQHREQYFYHDGLLDACCSAIISNDWGFADAIIVLEKLICVRHTQIPLLDYIVGKCFEDPQILDTCSPSYITTIVGGLAKADYKPVFWDVIQDVIVSDRVVQNESLKCPPSKYALNLLTLDCYCPTLLAKVFTTYSSKDNITTTARTIRFNNETSRVLQLYQTVKTLYPKYDGPLPTDEICNAVLQYMQTNKNRSYPLKSYLELGLGGRTYVLTNVTTKLGHFIDHVVVMRKGGFPVSINNEEESSESNENPLVTLEDLQPPANSQAILISLMPQHSYSINSQRIFGTSSLRIRTLEALTGYTVIPIISSMWMSLQEAEKIPYLMQAIRLKCERIPVSANS